jgi:ABC-2 type transport system permease protein
MTAAALPFRAAAPATRTGEPRLVITRHVARSAMRWAIVWGVVFGVLVLSTAQAFVVGYPTIGQRLQVARSLQTFTILLGPLHHAETVAGFTMWRVLMGAALIGAIWGLRTSTGLLRGEEDEGRWELLLVGHVTRRRAAAEALLGLAVAQGAMFLATMLLVLATRNLRGAHFPLDRSLLFAVALVSDAAMFLAIGAVTSQLSATRGQAASLATAVLGASYAIRLVADSTRSLGWLRWLTPLGWLEELRPLRDPQPIALVPIVSLIALCAGATVVLAGQRDLNGSILKEGAGHLRDVRWLRGPFTLALRLSRGGAIGWLLGVAAMSYVEGVLARSAAAILASSPAFTSALRKLGVRQGAQGYLGAAFLFVAVLLAVLAASQIAAIRDEEASGRLDNLLVRPVHRLTWLAGRLSVSFGLLATAGVLSGLVTWVGAASQHAGVPLSKLLEAGVNAAVPGVFVLGAGVLMLGLYPRFASILSYGIVAYSFLVNLVGTVVKGNDWIRDSSLFTHIALAPATKPDWFQATVLALIGLGMAALGAVLFHRRDIEYA